MEVVTKSRRGRPGKSSEPFRKMSVSERQALEQEKQALEAQKQDMAYGTHPEKGELDTRIRQLSDLLSKDEDAEAKGSVRSKLEGIRNTLAERIKLEVPPLAIQKARPGTPEYGKAVDWAERSMQPDVVKMCEQYQDVCRRLDPQNPNAGSIEELVS